MTRVEQLYEQGLIRRVDYYFAVWLREQGCTSETLEVLAALVSQQSGEGHICIHLAHLDELFSEWPISLKVQMESASQPEMIAALVDQSLLGDGSKLTPLVLDKGRLYLYRYWLHECQVAQTLLARSLPVATDHAFLDNALNDLFGVNQHETDWQRVAAATAVQRKVAIISGGPGTGKTTTVTKMLAIYLLLQQRLSPHNQPVIRLAAPTGKAAARLSESIATAKHGLNLSDDILAGLPEQGTTLHRLLGARPAEHGYRYNAENPLHVDLLVVDEASMVDLPLMAALLSALPQSARLVLIGDRQQLASVEAGSVLGDLCAIPDDPAERTFAPSVAFLKKSYRFCEDSGIGALAKGVNSGEIKAVREVLNRGYQDLEVIPAPTSDNERLIAEMLKRYAPYVQAVEQHQEPFELLKLFGTFQVLCGQRRGVLGVETLNPLFEKALVMKHNVSMNGRWYAGRPVMITRNDASLGLYNGDIGITLLDKMTGRFKVWFDLGGKLASFSTSRLPSHETVFAMTVHKSQGSEFDHVLLVLGEDNRVNSRELVYTGITRAKKKCILYGAIKTLESSTQKPTLRMSGLAERIWGAS